MIDPAHINSVIFDFSGTLSCGRYFAPLGPESLDAIGSLVFGSNSSQWADPWMKGELTNRDIVDYLSKHLPESKDEILSALRQGCSSMAFNPAVCEFARQQRGVGRKTALVTANMDVFSQIVVPVHSLHSLFDLVLNTSDYRTLDKTDLWRKALSTFGAQFAFASSLLIDDSPNMVSQFQSLGGHAYCYDGDASFQNWLVEAGFQLGDTNLSSVVS